MTAQCRRTQRERPSAFGSAHHPQNNARGHADEPWLGMNNFCMKPFTYLG